MTDAPLAGATSTFVADVFVASAVTVWVGYVPAASSTVCPDSAA